MIGLVRLAIFGAVALTIVYWLVSAYSRSLRRERLEKDWDATRPADAGSGDREAWIARGMEAYEHGLRRRLIWLVYVIPAVLFAVVTFIVNYN